LQTVCKRAGRAEHRLAHDAAGRRAGKHLALERPEAFTLCCGDDRTSTPMRFRALLERTDRELKRQLDGRSALLTSVEPMGREPWRL
jgi:YD repeat-containing protein